MSIYSSIFEEIKLKVALEDEVEKSGAKLLRSGNSRMKCCCPLHEEKSPSFIIYKGQDYNTFYCWGCSFGGDVITFVRSFKNFSTTKETIEYFKKNYTLEFCSSEKNLDEIFSNEIRSKQSKNKTIYNYGISTSKSIKRHLSSVENPVLEYGRISSYLKAIDIAIYEGNVDMLKFQREMFSKYIKDSKNGNRKNN